jgi:hypothetical protein
MLNEKYVARLWHSIEKIWYFPWYQKNDIQMVLFCRFSEARKPRSKSIAHSALP